MQSKEALRSSSWNLTLQAPIPLQELVLLFYVALSVGLRAHLLRGGLVLLSSLNFFNRPLPAFDRHLFRTGYRELSGRRIAREGRARAERSPLADTHRRNELRI